MLNSLALSNTLSKSFNGQTLWRDDNGGKPFSWRNVHGREMHWTRSLGAHERIRGFESFGTHPFHINLYIYPLSQRQYTSVKRISVYGIMHAFNRLAHMEKKTHSTEHTHKQCRIVANNTTTRALAISILKSKTITARNSAHSKYGMWHANLSEPSNLVCEQYRERCMCGCHPLGWVCT